MTTWLLSEVQRSWRQALCGLIEFLHTKLVEPCFYGPLRYAWTAKGLYETSVTRLRPGCLDLSPVQRRLTDYQYVYWFCGIWAGKMGQVIQKCPGLRLFSRMDKFHPLLSFLQFWLCTELTAVSHSGDRKSPHLWFLQICCRAHQLTTWSERFLASLSPCIILLCQKTNMPPRKNKRRICTLF